MKNAMWKRSHNSHSLFDSISSYCGCSKITLLFLQKIKNKKNMSVAWVWEDLLTALLGRPTLQLPRQ